MTPGNHVIGKNNDLPWKLSTDLKRFRKLTTGKPIIMGRKTYESIGRPLPNRTNIILSRSEDFNPEGCIVFNSLVSAIEYCKKQEFEEAMLIGGHRIFKYGMEFADELLISFVLGEYDGDVHFPAIGEEWKMKSFEYCEKGEKDDCSHSFVVYMKK